MLEMNEFVEHHVVGHLDRHLHEPPIERNVAARRAGPPARLLIADLDTTGTQSVGHSERHATCRQFRSGLGAPVVMERCPQAVDDGMQWKGGRTAADRTAIADDRMLMAAVPGTCAAAPLGAFATPGPLGGDPVTLPRHEGQSSVDGRPARHGDPDDAGCRQPENVAPGQAVPHDLDRKDPPSGLDDPRTRSGGGPWQTQLHRRIVHRGTIGGLLPSNAPVRLLRINASK